jgi:hypothetical protein
VTLSKIANRVIDLAHRVREYYATELPKRHPDYPLIRQDEERVLPPPEEKELEKFLASLSEEQVYRLILIMYLGRGDFGIDELAGYYEALKGTFEDSRHAASQMMDKAPLGDYLLDGLKELRSHNIDVDKMPLKRIKVRKP